MADPWKELLTSPFAERIRGQRLIAECLEVADVFLHWQDYFDAETGEQIPPPPDEWIDMASPLVACGIWLGMSGVDDPELCRAEGGHVIANRLRRLRRALPEH